MGVSGVWGELIISSDSRLVTLLKTRVKNYLLMKTMIYGDKMSPNMLRLGYYISPLGGALNSHAISEGRVGLEWLTAGNVYGPEGNKLYGPGSIFIHRAGQHTVNRSPEYDHYECMTVEFDVSRGKLSDAWPRSVEWPEKDGGVDFAREMIFEHHHSRLEKGIMGRLIWSQLAYRIAKGQREQTLKKIPPRIASCLAYLDRNYEKPCPVEDLAERVGLSASHLHTRFREFVGVSPYQYLIQQRMRAARHMLVTTMDPVKSIAVDVGYANTENFCRAFKKETGMTAAGFRRKYMVYS
jgi:AraC-like DNA-binding protein